jgi:heat shock protein HslJ
MGDGAAKDRVSGQGVGEAVHPLQDRTFVATSVTECGEPRPLVPGTQLRLGFPAGRITAEAGCNIMNADVAVGPDRLRVGDIASTHMGCEPERERQDRMVAEFIAAGPSWSLTADRLTLTAGDHRFDLTEERSRTGQLWGRTFVSVAVHESGTVPAPVVEGTEIVLTFTAPDRLTAHAGCNTLMCQAQVDDARLHVADDVASTRMACSDELQAQDEWLSAFLVDDPEYTFTGDTLTLSQGSTEIVLVTKQR